MKKLLFLGLVMLNGNLFSMQEKLTPLNHASQKQQLSKVDKIKIGTALLGCAFFTVAALRNKSLFKTLQFNSYASKDNKRTLKFKNIPSLIAAFPLLHLIENNNNESFIKKMHTLSALYCPLLAVSLGTYALYKTFRSTGIKKINNKLQAA